MTGALEEAAKATGGFIDAMRSQPMGLALIAMNILLIAYLFYSGSTTSAQRRETVELIVNWQKETDKLMANCVSAEVTRLMLDNMQMITKTMLEDRDKEASRMQGVINRLEQKLFQVPEQAPRGDLNVDPPKPEHGEIEPPKPAVQDPT